MEINPRILPYNGIKRGEMLFTRLNGNKWKENLS